METPDALAAAIADGRKRPVLYRDVETDDRPPRGGVDRDTSVTRMSNRAGHEREDPSWQTR